MNLEKLEKLLDAGFTKEEILNLVETSSEENASEENASEENASEETKAEEENASEETKTEENSTMDIASEMFDKLTNSIDALNKKVETFNRTNAEMNVENKGKESLEDILARVLLPNGKDINK